MLECSRGKNKGKEEKMYMNVLFMRINLDLIHEAQSGINM